MHKNLVVAFFLCAFVSTPVSAQGFPGGFPGGGFPVGGLSSYACRPLNRNPGSVYEGRLPPCATTSTDFDIVEHFAAPSSGGGGGGFASGPGGDGSGGFPTPPVPADCHGCYPVQNSHNGAIMGWKNPDETWYDFWTGNSGHLDPMWAQEGQICMQQMIGAGMNPYDPHGFMGL